MWADFVDQPLHIVGVMLPIAVEEDDDVAVRRTAPGPEARTVSLVPFMPDDVRAGRCGYLARVVVGAVVND